MNNGVLSFLRLRIVPKFAKRVAQNRMAHVRKIY